MFGVNQFGDPYFKIVWGQSQFLKMGNLWTSKNGTETIEYRECYQLDGKPGWNVMRWKPPSHYGSPEQYYQNTYDPLTRLYITGEYPWRGRYESILSMNSKELVNGKLEIVFLPLSHFMIDTIIPLILKVQQMSKEERRLVNQYAEQQESKRQTELIADKMMENMPVWMQPVSYGRQGCRTSRLDKKMSDIQQVWNRYMKRGKKPVFSKGIAQGNKPIVQGYTN